MCLPPVLTLLRRPRPFPAIRWFARRSSARVALFAASIPIFACLAFLVFLPGAFSCAALMLVHGSRRSVNRVLLFCGCMTNASGNHKEGCPGNVLSSIQQETSAFSVAPTALSTKGLTTALISSVVVGATAGAAVTVTAAVVFCAYPRAIDEPRSSLPVLFWRLSNHKNNAISKTSTARPGTANRNGILPLSASPTPLRNIRTYRIKPPFRVREVVFDAPVSLVACATVVRGLDVTPTMMRATKK